MAQRFKASDLHEMIRRIVRQEMGSVMKEAINEALSDRFLKHLAENAVGARPRGVSDLSIMGDEEQKDEETPHPLRNTILGVGQEDPVFKKTPKPDHVRQPHEGKNRDEMLSLFFEGTRPLAERERESPTEDELNVPALPKPMAEQADIWKRMVQGMDRVAENKRPMSSPESEEARIKKMREELDRKVV